MGIFEILYNWSLYDLLGFTSTSQATWLLPSFALLITYISMFMLLYSLFWLVKWVIRFVSMRFFWE